MPDIKDPDDFDDLDDLNFDDLISDDDVYEEESLDNKKPIIGAAKAFTKEAKSNVLDSSNIKRLMDKALPTGFSEELEKLPDAEELVESILGEEKSSIISSVEQLGGFAANLAGGEESAIGGRISKLVSKLRGSDGEEYE